TTASFVSGEYFGLAIKLHLTQLGVQLLGCSPFASPGERFRVHILHVSKTAFPPVLPVGDRFHR
ncbi:hypothetical protein, partial [Klebsiella pneumoniae]|uniref:hypothetical protein n=1 Tax=Klebsiella pneumoniae TaxID=573 RepID=UPI001C6F869E